MKKIENCPICGNTYFLDFIKVKDFFLSNEEFTIQECKQCQFRFVNPQPETEDLQSYYKSQEYISHSNTKKGLINKIYHIARIYNLAKKYKYIRKYKKNGTLLDIGCGTGEFLRYCKNKHWNVLGIEPDENARQFAQDVYNLNVKPYKDLLLIEDHSFDVITMWHVLEHVQNVNEYLLEIKRLIKHDGLVFIALPNHLSYDAQKYQQYWAAWDVPRHLYHFTPISFKKLIQKYNFTITQIIHMKIDSYYVSLLSEKYKHGKVKYFSAFFNGMKSNCKAKENSNYSSLIYILKNDLK